MLLVDICITRGDECEGTVREILVVTNRKNGGFTTPGGKIDPGEEPRSDDEIPYAAAIRELEEETGLKATEDMLLYNGYFSHRWRGIHVKCHSFVGHMQNFGDQEPRQVEEGTKPFWVERDELLDPDSECIAQSFYGWLMAKMHWDFEAE